MRFTNFSNIVATQKIVVFLYTLFSSTLTVAEETFSGFRSIINLPEGVTTVSNTMYDIHMIVLWICVAIGVLVFGFMFYVLWAYRKSRGHEPQQFHENLSAEILWTIIPALIVIALIWPSTQAIIKSYDTDNAELIVQVTGLQWKWQYEYPETGIKFLSELTTPADEINNKTPKGEYYLREVSNPLVLPVDTKVVFNITAADVIHSFSVPDFGVKKDAIPGFVTESWANIPKTGYYYGNCTELCGVNHAFMPVVVKVVEKEEFKQWIQDKKDQEAQLQKAMQQTASMDQMIARGEKVYNRSCAACHGVNGKGIPGAFPSLINSPYIVGAVEHHINIVVNGKTGTSMQAFGNQLNELDLAAVITYERNAWGNNQGDLIQAVDIVNFKSKK